MKMQHAFILLLICTSTVSFALQFDHLTIDDGLSSNHVYCIFQDSAGFMWFGTNRGLNRWDGVDVRLFEHDSNDSTTLTSNDIRTIMEDDNRVMWVGTYHGLNRFDRSTETFTRYYFFRDEKNSNYVKTILADGDSLLWLGTNFGLIRFHKKTGEFERFVHLNENGDPHIWRNYIYKLNWMADGTIIVGTMDDFIKFDPRTHIYSEVHSRLGEKKWAGGFWSCIDKNNRVWMGMSGWGLFCYDQQNESIKSYAGSEGTVKDYFACTANILEDHNGVLWFATLGGGLFRFDEHNDKFIQYFPRVGDEASISSSVVCFLYEDRQGNLWIGTYDAGANKIPRWSKNIRFHRRHEKKEESIGDGAISSLCEDRDGVLWVTSGGGGATWIQPDFWTAGKVKWNGARNLGNVWFQTIERDNEGNIWVAPPIHKYDWNSKTTSLEVPSEVNGKRTYNGAIRTICQDSSGNMWFGTTFGGLLKLDQNHRTKVYVHSPTDSISLPRNQIPDILCDHEGVLWIGTMNGLSRLLPGEDKFTNFYATGSSAGNDSNAVMAIIEDSASRIWLCSPFSLYYFDRETSTFENKKLPLAKHDSGPLAILQDHNHNLWLRTYSGMIRYNPETGNSRYFDAGDGFTGINTCIWRFKAFICGRTGHIYYGGSQIVGRFHPDSLFENPDPPKVLLTDLEVNYNRVHPGRETWFPRALSHADELKLPRTAKAFAIDFAALDYTNPKNNQYAYKLEGFHRDWIYCGAQKRATFTALPPGDYVFHVKASNNDGVWNEEGASLKIHILPPWWRTTWAWMLWSGLFIAAIYGAYRLQLNRARLQQQVQLEHDHAQKLSQLDHVKSTFFANVSHEFRTPLTLILGPLEEIQQKSRSAWLKKQCSVMLSNGRRLLALINQLLDFSALEAGGLKLLVSETDMVAFVKRVVASFMSLAERKQISLQFTAGERIILAYIDHEQFEKVLVNVLSNAFKFTPEKGRIDVSVDRISDGDADAVEIKIRDSGLGMAKEDLDHIFNRFYQVNDERTKNAGGTGIGLALSRELVELHGGCISVSSEPGRGSEFSVRLPLGCEHFADDVEIVEDRVTESFFEPAEEEFREAAADDLLDDHRKACVLIVEDNADVRQYVRDILTPDFRTREAADGEQGFAKAVERLPDLILSDVMMPLLDGFELSRRLKSDERTSHIPIILLTARASDAGKIEGLELGVDDYIIKPFNARELKTRVKNLILQRKKLREKFSRSWISDAPAEGISPISERFLQRALELVEAHLDDPDFDAAAFADQMSLSRMQLHRKLKALTNMTTTQFVAAVRLKRAAELLQNRTDTVSQIAFQVGFNNPSYFAECFKKMYGVAPSGYAANQSL